MRPNLALNCLLQIEQERSEEESSVGDALAVAFRRARFCSASLILFASYSPAPLFMRPRHFVRVLLTLPIKIQMPNGTENSKPFYYALGPGPGCSKRR